MRIRSVTIGTNVSYPLETTSFHPLDPFQRQARALFQEAGLPVQTIRLASQPFPEILQDVGPAGVMPLAKELEALCQAQGIDYVSIGPVIAAPPEASRAYIDVIPDIIEQTEMVFASVLVAAPTAGIDLDAIERAAAVIADIAHSTAQGFGNLRFAVLANCRPGSPFFPAAFHRGPGTAFSVATEAADLAVDAFSGTRTLEQARENLRAAVEGTAQTIEGVGRMLEAEFGYRFGGIDFSLAPYPEVARSIGQAIERLGVDAFGANSTLFAAALITRTLQQAQFPRCGFSGLLLPVLEDMTIGRRSAESMFTLDSLLLYSAVCGTGLDTIPLPGDVGASELAAILLDVATLAIALDKPLTARLMPIPGKKPGDATDFDFPYFARARVLDVKERGGSRLFEHNHFVDL